ncbi:MAG: hypothetical protein M3P51_01255 [Chloroflexota bacterium]|nr:hypothetical protein [Chloroflexota bacterium]
MRYEGSGTFVQRGDSIRMILRGRWSNSTDEEVHTTRLGFQYVQGVLELRVGAPCDGSSIERYRRQ